MPSSLRASILLNQLTYSHTLDEMIASYCVGGNDSVAGVPNLGFMGALKLTSGTLNLKDAFKVILVNATRNVAKAGIQRCQADTNQFLQQLKE